MMPEARTLSFIHPANPADRGFVQSDISSKHMIPARKESSMTRIENVICLIVIYVVRTLYNMIRMNNDISSLRADIIPKAGDAIRKRTEIKIMPHDIHRTSIYTGWKDFYSAIMSQYVVRIKGDVLRMGARNLRAGCDIIRMKMYITRMRSGIIRIIVDSSRKPSCIIRMINDRIRIDPGASRTSVGSFRITADGVRTILALTECRRTRDESPMSFSD